jgi:hypothetical protein
MNLAPIPESDPYSLKGFDVAVRDTAYFLWEQAGQPFGRSDEFWHQALEQHIRARAYAIWLYEGRPEGHAEDNWQMAKTSIEQETANEPV